MTSQSTVALRVGVATIAAWVVAVGTSAVFKSEAPKPWQESGGKVIRCARSFPFEDQASIVTYGLQDPRGLAWDPQSAAVLIADGAQNEVLRYSVRTQSFGSLGFPCLGGDCRKLDLRGIAVSQNRVFAAERNLGRIASPSPIGTIETLPLEEPGGIGFLRDGTVVATSRLPWPAKPSLGDVLQWGKWPGGESKTPGALYLLRKGAPAQLVDGTLSNPTGVAISIDEMKIYVAETGLHTTRWVVFEKGAAGYERNGALTATEEGPPTALFEGLVADNRFLYAAGAGGLYVVDLVGTTVGRVEFDAPVSGVTQGYDNSGKRCLYFAVGHALAKLVFP